MRLLQPASTWVRNNSLAAITVINFLAGCATQAPAQSGKDLPAAQAATTTQVNWNQFHFTAYGSRQNSAETILSPESVSGLKVKWTSPIGSYSFSSPAVVSGVVYVGAADDYVYALNASTGAKLWRYKTGGVINYSSPAVAGGMVYIGSWDDNVYALNAKTGAKAWSFKTGYIIDSSPAVANGVVYVGSADCNLYGCLFNQRL